MSRLPSYADGACEFEFDNGDKCDWCELVMQGGEGCYWVSDGGLCPEEGSHICGECWGEREAGMGGR